MESLPQATARYAMGFIERRLRNFHERRQPPTPENERAALLSGYTPPDMRPNANPDAEGPLKEWPLWTVVPAGTVFYRGTSTENVTPEQPWPYTWFSRRFKLASMFANQYEDLPEEDSVPRIHRYVLERDLHLPLIGSERELKKFANRFGIDLKDPRSSSRGMNEAGFPGWVSLNQYGRGEGDDILIGDVANLRYECSFDGDGHPLGPLPAADGPMPGRM